jgi:tetratricopeptide (TPR) repeat protein
VIHRDLKPDNVLVATDGSYRIADFGIARLEGATTLTQTGALLGTLRYLAPERVRGAAGDARCDLFALGAILYEALTGRPAFPGDHEAAVLYTIQNEDPPAPALPPSLAPLASLVMKLLAKEPSQRPPSAEAAAAVIEVIGAPGARPQVAPRQRRTWVGVGAALLVAALVGFWWMRTHSAGSARAAPPAVAVLYFENLVDAGDRERMGAVTSNLLVTSLAQVPGLNVVSTQRVLEAMRRLGRMGAVADKGVALEIAKRVRATRLVTGSILRVTPVLMTAEVTDVATGRLVRAERVEGLPGQTVFEVVDLLGSRLQDHLGFPGEPTRLAPVASRSSADLEAYRHYVAGLEHFALGAMDSALARFSASVARDSQFAQAQFQLAIVQGWLQDYIGTAAKQASLSRARALADRLTPLERQALSGWERHSQGDDDGAFDILQPLARDFPDDRLAQYCVMEAAAHGGRYHAAIGPLRKLLEMNPDDEVALNHLARVLVPIGRTQEAESILRAALKRHPDNSELRDALAVVLVDEGRGTEARDVLRGPLERGYPGAERVRIWLTLGLDSIPTPGASIYVKRPWAYPYRVWAEYWSALQRGRFRAALAIAKRWWEHPDASGGFGAWAALAAGDTVQAAAWTDSGTAAAESQGGAGSIWGLNSIAGMLREGRMREAQALLERIDSHYAHPDPDHVGLLLLPRGLILGEEGHLAEAVRLLQRATSPMGGPIYRRFFIGRYGVRAGLFQEALAALDTVVAAPLLLPDDAVRAHFYRAQALEPVGRRAEAAREYRWVLSVWRNADPGTPEVDASRAALRRLAPS